MAFILILLLPGIITLFYIYKTDKKKKKRSLRFLGSLLAAGMAAKLPGCILSGIVSGLSVEIDPFVFKIPIGILDTMIMYLLLRKISWNSTDFEHSFDAVVYAACIAVGMNITESIGYLFVVSAAETVVLMGYVGTMRIFCSVFMGALYADTKYASLKKDKKAQKRSTFLSVASPILIYGINLLIRILPEFAGDANAAAQGGNDVAFEEAMAGAIDLALGTLALLVIYWIILFSTTLSEISWVSRKEFWKKSVGDECHEDLLSFTRII